MKTYTEPQLQAALVRALPKKLRYQQSPEWCEYFIWLDGGHHARVTPHEWPAIVGMVEDRLNGAMIQVYVLALWRAVNGHEASIKIMEPFILELKMIACAKWPVRAQALVDIGAIKVEEEK